MTAREIFFDFEKKAIEWAKQYQIAKVGDIVTSSGGGKTNKSYIISSIEVVLGRNAQETTYRTLVLVYYGKKINKKGDIMYAHAISARLVDFVTGDGQSYNISENEVTETVNDIGLTFMVEVDKMELVLQPIQSHSYEHPIHCYTR
jgi:hypothetical protein